MEKDGLKYIFDLNNKKPKNNFSNFLKSKNTESSYWLTRFIILRFIGIVYFIAFLSLALQVIPLIGENGLLPANNYLDSISPNFGVKLL